MKTIAYITGCYPRATDTFIQREVQGLRASGWNVLPYAVRRPGDDHAGIVAVAEEKQRTTYLLPFRPWSLLADNLTLLVKAPLDYLRTVRLAARSRKPGLKGALYQSAYFLEATVLAADLKRKGVAHLHNHLGDASATVTMLAAKLAGIRFSMTIHGPHIFFEPVNWALREKVAEAAFVACIGDFCKSQVMLFSARADWRKLAEVRCGVDMAAYAWRPPRDSGIKILFVGRLAAEKGILVLLESFAALIARMPHAQLRLAGDGEDRKVLEARVAELGLAERVVFLGYCSQETVRAELESADLFVLPSFAEGVPVSLMEAMAIGVPVVSTYVGGIAELVVPNETGLLVPAGSVPRLVEAMFTGLTDAAWRQRVSIAARAKVVRDYNLQTQVQILSDLFQGGANAGQP